MTSIACSDLPETSAITDLPISECTIPSLLSVQAERHPDSILLEIDGKRYTYNETRHLVARTAGMLIDSGLHEGDRLAIMSQNRLELIQLVLGCAWMGAVAVPLNAELRDEQLRHALVNSGAEILAMSSDLCERLEDIEVPATLQTVWYFDGTPAAGSVGVAMRPLPECVRTVPAASCTPGQTAVILYTSGTTGVSKGVECPHAQFYWWGVSVSKQLGISANDVLFTTLPMFHTNALNAFFQALVSGAQIVVAPRFSASRFWDQARKCRATVTYLLGAMINILWSKEPDADDSVNTLRIALSPATPAELSELFTSRFGFTLVDGFGSTETNSTLSAAPFKPRPGYLGVTQPGYEAIVVDEHDREVPDGVPGELLLRSRYPYAFATGYYGMPEKTVEAWRNLWFHTGDRVVREKDGWFRFVDRIKDVIRRRGENISSFEVEQAIGLLPTVEAVAAFPVKSDMAEDEVMIALIPKSGETVTPQEVVDHCVARLPKFAIPRFIDVVESLPMTANGKIRKNVLREQGKSASTWDREGAVIDA